jgi:hypothetical protein
MRAFWSLFVVAMAVVAYRWLLRRTQRTIGVDPDVLVSLVQRRPWLQWYLVVFLLLLAGVIYASTSGAVELTRTEQLALFIGGFVLLVVPLYIAKRHD